jgi:hypothetical protein
MVPEEWPIAAQASDRSVEPSRRAGRSRLATVRRDFFLDPTQRLTEQERALMTAMLDGLVVQIADELRALIGSSAAANDDSGHALLAELHASGLLDIPELIALLLRRAEQIQMMSAIQSRGARRDGKLLQAQLSDENAAVAAAAMSLILARGRRLDQFGQCRLDFDDVPPRAVRPLVNAVGAAIGSAQPALHHQVAAAAAQLIAGHKPQRSLDVVTANLIDALADNDRLNDEWLLDAADEGEGALLAHGLARRAAIAPDEAAETLLARDAEQLMLLFRLAGLSRGSAARLLAGLSDVLGVADPVAALSSFDGVSQAQLIEARLTMILPQEYRDALSAFDGSHGKRAL